MFNKRLSTALSTIPLGADCLSVLSVGQQRTILAVPSAVSSFSIQASSISTTRHKMLSLISKSKQESDNIVTNGTLSHHQKGRIERNGFKGYALVRDDLSASLHSLSKQQHYDEYQRAIQDLNLLQSNTQAIALAKYKSPKDILPLFAKQLRIAGIDVCDLNRLNIIHVSGTKGKGSTCAFTESILRSAGHKTGFYNSPHLVKVTERIKLNGRPIDEVKFGVYFRHVFNRLLDGTKRENITMPSYFSFLTILAFHVFLEEKVDCAIIEVGIGGEYDPTNIIQSPVACGISTLDYDHTNILGDKIDSIAWSKAGIAKKGAPLFVIEQDHDEALEMIRSRAIEKGSPLYICRPLQGSQLGIKGSVQNANASLACQLASQFLRNINHHSIEKLETTDKEIIETNFIELPTIFREGLMNCSWPGRCQTIRYPRITFFLDGAHTKKSMENCLDWFLSETGDKSANVIKILMLNVIGERNKREVLRPLSRYSGFEVIIFSTNKISSSSRDSLKSDTFVSMRTPTGDKSMENVQNNAQTWNCLMDECGGRGSDVKLMSSTSDSLRYLIELSRGKPDKKYQVLVTGSLHYVGAILETLPAFQEVLS